jgi:hypothetical protein
MKQFDLYDILAFLAPGTITLLGLVHYCPGRFAPLTADKVSFGELGVFILLAYIAGNVIAGIGGVVASKTKIFGGLPTNQIKENDGKVISKDEYTQLQTAMLAKNLIKEGDTIKLMGDPEWTAATRRIHSFLDARGLTQRVEMFNAKFGLNQNLVIAFLLLLGISAYKVQLADWKIQLTFLVCAIWCWLRVREFGRLYAQTLIRTFLTAPEKPVAAPAVAAE